MTVAGDRVVGLSLSRASSTMVQTDSRTPAAPVEDDFDILDGPPAPPPPAWGMAVVKGFGMLCAGVAVAALPFMIVPWLPRKRFGALPWYPTSVRRVRAMLDHVRAVSPAHVARGRRFIDLGSGDGVAVIEAARRYGMHATGVELNPTLVAMSKVRTWWNRRAIAKAGGSAAFNMGDLFAQPIDGSDVIMVFGVVPLMPRIAAKIEAEMTGGSSAPAAAAAANSEGTTASAAAAAAAAFDPSAPPAWRLRSTYVCSHKFPFPAWDHLRIATVDDIHIYRWTPAAGAGTPPSGSSGGSSDGVSPASAYDDDAVGGWPSGGGAADHATAAEQPAAPAGRASAAARAAAEARPSSPSSSAGSSDSDYDDDDD